MLKRMSRRARVSTAIAFLAASAAALPSLDWCPLTDWTSAACEFAIAAEPANAHEGSPCGAASTTCPMARSAACEAAASPFCEVERDPLPAGDKLWCVRPPVTAITAKLVPLAAPAANATFVILAAPILLAPPDVAMEAPLEHAPRPPTSRAAHAPPQPRAPPAA